MATLVKMQILNDLNNKRNLNMASNNNHLNEKWKVNKSTP